MNQFVPLIKPRPLTGAQKSAILFLCMGETRGGALMQQLEVKEIRQITAAISTMGEVDAAVVEEVLKEFGEKINHNGGVTGSVDAARSLLKEFLPDERVDEILLEINGHATDNVWKNLSEMEAGRLADLLRKEHNQTVAVILSRISPDASAKVLPKLGAERAPDLIERMIALENLPNEAIQSIENTLREDVLPQTGSSAGSRIERQLVSIFNKLDEDLFNSISQTIEERDPDRLKAIRQQMFVFDDLIKFDPNQLGKIMREVGGNTLPLALRGAKKELREHFLSSLPSRSRGMLQDEMSSMGPVKLREVKEAQARLVEAATRLLADGTVELDDSTEEMLAD
jgi:flagellar motor switch protein FliG